jgi:3-deoxy-D-manno-octulosonic-acid transferase
MTHLLYDIILTIFLIFAAPYFLLRGIIDLRFRRELIQRMGFLPTPSLKKPVWVHAASVGEVLCTIPLLKRIKKEFSECAIVLTTMTRTGNERAKTIPEADLVFFLPIDHPLHRSSFERLIQAFSLSPRQALAEPAQVLWKERVPIILFNGRISKIISPLPLFRPFPKTI